MALTGLKIQKLLPGTNCKDCGSNTCMAFAMKLAGKKADISLCPHASEEAIAVLGAATEPPVRKLSFGKDEKNTIGDETVLYRHEKTFVNQTLIAININDNEPDKTIEEKLKNITTYVYERVGEELFIDMVALTQIGEDDESFIQLLKRIIEENPLPLIVKSKSLSVIEEACQLLDKSNSIIYPENADENDTALMQKILDSGNFPVLSGKSIDEIYNWSAKIRDEVSKDFLIDLHAGSLALQFQLNSIMRRASIKDSVKPLGQPLIKYITTEDLSESTVEATNEINKYGGICVLPTFDAAQLATLLTLRLNIFTDPQKPIQVEPNVYPIGSPNEDSPVFVTTNFSLTYFVVSGEIENSGLSAWLLVPECEGMSVLTAWAAGKFNATSIHKFSNDMGLSDKIKNKKMVIPGFVAQISGELDDLLKDWEVMVGPQEASDIESFIKLKLAG